MELLLVFQMKKKINTSSPGAFGTIPNFVYDLASRKEMWEINTDSITLIGVVLSCEGDNQ